MQSIIQSAKIYFESSSVLVNAILYYKYMYIFIKFNIIYTINILIHANSC